MRPGRRVALVLVLPALFWPATARAEQPARAPADRDYLQYGLAFAAEAIASAGDVCPAGSVNPCILGSGGGVGVRVGYRARDPWYLGGSYQFSRHDSSNLFELAILQQARAEGRYYFEHGDRATAFVTAALGVHLYGDEWRADTGGGLLAAGAGLELQLSPSTAIGCMALYRMLVPRAWTDSAGARRADGLLGFGLAHLVALELTLEVREQLRRF